MINKKNYSLSQIADITGGTVLGDNTYCISQLLIDSRAVSQPEASLFFALKGPHHNGSDYINNLIKIGVRCFVVSSSLPLQEQWTAPHSSLHFILIPSPLLALQHLAAWHLSQYNIPKIAITGSNGKTIVKEWLAQLLSPQYTVTKSPLSYNSQVGVPLSLWLVNEQTDICIFEAGISRTKEMQILQELIHPTHGIFTHLGDAHQENFNSVEEKCREKMQLFKNVEVLVYCRDHEMIHQLTKELHIHTYSWGKHAQSDLQITSIQTSNNNSLINITTKKDTFQIQLPFSDPVSIENAMHAFTLAYALNGKNNLQMQLSQLYPIAMRQEIKEGIRNNIIINDSYNSDITSIHLSLNLLEQKKSNHTHQVFILSDVFQSGQSSKNLYTEVANSIQQHHINTFIGVGTELSKHQHLFAHTPSHFFTTTEELYLSPLLDSMNQAAILIKGARHFKLEKIAKKLEKKSYQTTLEVNLDAITHNLNYFREKLHSNTRIMAMVKANAYGCGAIEVARHLQYQGCNFLAVALADEGAELRESGIQIPIVVMNPEPYTFDTIVEHQLELEIYSLDLLRQFHAFLMRIGVNNYPIHIKIDSGMNRLGFKSDDLHELCLWLKHHSSVEVKSVFSHLAGSDDPSLDSFTKQQIETYTQAANFIEQELQHPALRHVLNSAGVVRFPEHQMNMVRLGVGLYAKTSAQDTHIKTVSRLETQILQIKSIHKGDTVGYGRKGIATKDTRIAILPIGYADGLNRGWGNGVSYVLWNNIPLPFIGNICMDMCMIDAGEHGIQAGDKVLIFGEELPPYQLAEKISTIVYEVLTQVSSRVKKVYLIQ